MSPMLLALAACSTLAVVVAAWLMLRGVDTDDQLAARIRAARGRWAEQPTGGAGQFSRAPVQRALAAIGSAMIRSGLVRGGMRQQLQRTLTDGGFPSPAALPLFVGGKVVLALVLPVLAWLGSGALGWQFPTRMLLTGAGVVVGLLTPDRVIAHIRKTYLSRLDDGLPDGLDLLVICVQAGLSLEAALVRVAAEMRLGQAEVAQELEMTVREMELMADTQLALANLADRTGLPTLKRMVSTLVQTMQYGTPLAEALRTLSAEVRQQALTRFETRAARLPVLLTLPMILFILPCVFIIVGGPAVIKVIRTVGE